MTKGKLCAVKGRISTRSYDGKDGKKRYITEVVAEEVQFLEYGNSKNGAEDYGEGITPVDDGDIPF